MTVCIIPARGGSKRIPRKNMKLFCGKPLVWWSIEQSKRSRLVDYTVVTTDDEEIADLAQESGAFVVMRPPDVAGDCVANVPISHAIRYIQDKMPRFDVMAQLLPTSPIRKWTDIDGAIALFLTKQQGLETEVTTLANPLETVVYEKIDGRARFLILDKKHTYYSPAGCVSVMAPEYYLQKSEYIQKYSVMDKELDEEFCKIGEGIFASYIQRPVIPYLVEDWQTFELDVPEQWSVAECVFEKYILAKGVKDGQKN